MKKNISILIILILCFFISGCSSKLTTIRPTLITRMLVEDMATGEKVEHMRTEDEEIAWLMDDLIIQMEQKYNHKGKCLETDQHIYYVQFYMEDKLELSVYINNDGSVCKNNKRYFLSEQNHKKNDNSVDLHKWAEFQTIGGSYHSQP